MWDHGAAVAVASGDTSCAWLARTKLATTLFDSMTFHSKQPKPVDRTLTMMRLDDDSDQPLAVIVNFTGHPTSLPAQTLKFSADYVGAL